MTPERWRQVEQLFQQALTLEPERRGSFLAQAPDEEIRHAIEMLLAQSSPRTSPVPVSEIVAPLTELAVGARLGPYEVAGILGYGGMGKVYRGVDTRLSRPVAIKVSAEIPGANFKREARAISALNHPHICTLYDVGPNYLVMELVEGESLAQRLDKGPMPVNEVLRCGEQIAAALAAAHARGIIHRDLKPGNIMLTAIGAKVLDFGLAKIILPVAETPSYSTTTQSVIAPGTIQGTLAYMAPEQLEGAECDARTDIFSFGLILFEMTTGKKAFPAASQATLIGDILHRQPDLRLLEPPGLKAIVEKCVAKKPEDRWQSAAEVEQALRVVEKTPTASLTEIRGGVSRPSRGFWMKALAVAAILIILGASGAGLWMRMRRPHAGGPVTVTPLGEYAGMVEQPSLSPDGSHVAFSWNGVDPQNFDVYVKAIGAGGALKGAPLRLTTDPADDFAPAWSPDGNSIAFLRQVGGGDHYLVLLVPALGGLERRLTEVTLADTSQLSGPYLAWLGDGQSLVITDASASGVESSMFLLSVNTGQRRQISFPPPGDVGDHCVSVSPDGSELLFQRGGLRPEWSGTAYLLRLGGGTEKKVPVESAVNECAAWAPDGQRLVYAAGLGLWTAPAVNTGTAPKLVIETGRGSNWPAVAHRANRMAYARRVGGDIEMWKMGITPSGETSGSATKFASAWRDEFTPSYSPDGTKVVFTAGRGSMSEIWVCLRDGSECKQLTWTDSANTGDPSWSPDGRFIAYYSTLHGRAQIYITPAQGGDARGVTPPDEDAVRPSWSRDGKWIYYSSRRTGSFQVWKVSSQSGHPVQVTTHGGYAPVESHDGKWLYYVSNGERESGLWRMRVSGGEPEAVLPAVLYRNFAEVDRGVYFIATSEEGVAIQFLDFVSRKTHVVAPVRNGYLGLAVSPDERTLLYTQISPATSQIYLIDNFR
jgi:Tol biopolymer transport system component/predicted Ser/Thr protein kinase